MNISYRSLLLLYCIAQIKSERSIYGLFHILTGKKSSQTIVDSNLYHLTHLFSVLKGLKREELLDCIRELTTCNLIQEVEENKFIPTATGLLILEQELHEKPIPGNLNGWKYVDRGLNFWKRLSLIIQVLSNLLNERKEYTTIQQDDEVLHWVKGFLTSSRGYTKRQLSLQVHDELKKCLQKIPDIEATIFVLRLSSFERIGLTFKQISSYLKQDETRVYVLFLDAIHSMLDEIENQIQEFPLLTQISQFQINSTPLTESTKKTYQFVVQGESIETIAKLRKLKKNTIEDHVVEIAHNISGFDITEYVSAERQKNIIEAQRELNTMRLKSIKEAVGIEVSYFEIRLVLAKSGGEE